VEEIKCAWGVANNARHSKPSNGPPEGAVKGF